MEPLAIYTDAAHVDVGAVRSFSLDMAFGADEQNFELTCSGLSLTGGEYLYIDGTEYGGVVDQYRQSTESELTAYIGRTWHGILAGKVVKPPSGQDYYVASGEANACIAALVAYVDLGAVFTVSSVDSGFTLNYQCERFCNAYEALLKMLKSAGATLSIVRHDGITELSAVSAALITDEADSDLMEFEVTKAHRVPNHLVCAGEGELQDRIVIDLYADANGNVSQTQSLFGIDEVALYYNYSGADEEDLLNDGTKTLKEYQTNGGADIGHVGRGSWRVGDVLQVRDNRTGTTVDAVIAKKIVKVERGLLTVDYEVGDNVAAQAASYKADLGGIAEQPIPVSMSKESANELINQLSEGSYATIYDDTTRIITQNTNTSYSNYLRRPISILWDYVKSKADGFFPLLLGGTALTSEDDLDDLKTVGTYYVSGASNVPQNAPGNYIGKVIVAIPHGLQSSAIRSQAYTNYVTGVTWYRKYEGGAWGAWWRDAPPSTTIATANRFLATPNGSAGLPSYRAIAEDDLPSLRTVNVLSLVSQSDAQAANFTVTDATLAVCGHVAQIRIAFKINAALTAGTQYIIGTLDAAIRPSISGGAGIGDRRAFAQLLNDGRFTMRPEIAYSASTTAYCFNATYLLANLYNG